MTRNQASKLLAMGSLLFFTTSAYSGIDYATVSPIVGVSGTTFTFNVTLDRSLPKNHKILIDVGNGTFLPMKGTGTQYRLSQKIYTLIGKQDYVVGIYDSQGTLQSRDSGSYTIKYRQDSLVALGTPKGPSTQEDRNQNGDSHFIKINHVGDEIDANAPDWRCVKDKHSGLMWEIKTTDFGLHDQRHTYSWYNPNDKYNGGDAGTQNGGHCVDSQCDTASYLKEVNAIGYCGYHNWRLPTVDELQSIVDYQRYSPSINTVYFPDLHNPNSEQKFWTASPYLDDKDSAWFITFYDGYSNASHKRNHFSIRLVRE